MTPRERVEKIEEECEGVWSQYGVTAWERTFLESVKERFALSVKQDETLANIETKVFEEN